jgi:hypothetical protein
MNTNKLHKDQTLTIAEQLKLAAVPNVHYASKRTNRFIPAAGGATYSPSGVSTILFNVPATIPWVDCDHSYLEFQLSGTGSSSPVLDKSVLSIFKRVTLRLANGMILEDITNANALLHMVNDVTQTENQMNYINALKEGYGGITNRTSYFTSGKSYTINLGKLFGSWSTEKHLPLSLLGGLQIQLELETAAQAVISGTAATYSVDSPMLNIEVLEFADELNNMIMQQWRTSGLYLKFSTYQEYTHTGTSSQETINIRPYHRSAKTLLISPRYVADQNQQTSGSFTRVFDNISQLTLSVDNSQQPTERTYVSGNNDSSVFVSDIQRAFNGQVNGVAFNPATFGKSVFVTGGSTFLLGFDLAAVPNPQFSSGVNAEQISLNIVSSGTSGSILYNCFLEHDVLAKISAQGGVEIFK